MAVIPATGPTDAGRGARQEFLDRLSALHASGIIAAILLAAWPVAVFASRWVPRVQDKALYLLLGAAASGTMVVARLVPQPRNRRPLAAVFSVLPVVLAACLGDLRATTLAIALAAVQAGCITYFVSRRATAGGARAASLVVVGFVSWAIALEMFAWEPMRTVTRPSLYLAALALCAIAAAARWAFGGSRVPAPGRDWLRAADVLAVLAIVLIAFRTDGLFTTDRLEPSGTFYHWGVLVAPAEAVRQGGWLFWDVSSPYGFLITLVIAAFPAPTAWQSLYLLNGIASALLGVWLYRLTRARWSSVAGAVFALAVAVAVVFLASNYPPTLAPEHYFPQSGPFRFGLCYLLAALLLLERSTEPRGRAQSTVLAAGSLCWIASALWSLDIAAVASLIWYPPLAMIVWRDGCDRRGSHRWGPMAAWLLAPPLAVGLLGWTIVEIYRAGIGHSPDLFAYVEVAASFAGSQAAKVATVLANATVTATVLPIVFGVVLLATVVSTLARQAGRERDVPLVAGLAGGVWGLLSYAIGEPFVFGFCRLMPFLVVGLTIVVSRVADSRDESTPWLDLVRSAIVAVIAAMLVSAYGNTSQLAYYASAIRHERFIGRDVTAGLPSVGRDLEHLLQQADVKRDDRLFYAGNVYGDTMPAWTPAGDRAPVRVSRQWLAGPISTMVFRSDDEKRSLIAHAIDRQREGGWLIERQHRRAIVYAIDAPFFDEVNRHFIPTRIVSDATWRLVRYEPAPGIAMDDLTWNGGRAPDPSAGIFANGQPVKATVTPEVWGYFGREWTTDAPWHRVDGKGTLHVFSPAHRAVRLIVSVPPGVSASDVGITAAENARVTRTGGGAGEVLVDALLAPGWNTFTVDRTTARAPAGGALRIGSVDVRY